MVKTVTKLDRDQVVPVALDLVVKEGHEALTMRRLAAELDVGTPTIYWHVGSRDELVAAIVERQSKLLADRPIVGATARDRVLCAAHNMYAGAVEQRSITSLAHQTGTSALLLSGLRGSLVSELEAAGLRGAPLEAALESILVVVTGALVVTLSASARLPGDGGQKRERTDVELDELTRATLGVIIEHHVPNEESP